MATLQSISNRYTSIQTFLQSSCYFLCLCTIAEEMDKKVDLIDAANECIARGWVTRDGWVEKPLLVLKWMTGKEFTLKVLDCVPSVVKENQFTVLKYRRDKMTHFRRRFCDTITDSQTVKKGQLESVYLFECIG